MEEIFEIGLKNLETGEWSLLQYEEFFEMLEERAVLEARPFQDMFGRAKVFDVGFTKFRDGTWSAEAYLRFL